MKQTKIVKGKGKFIAACIVAGLLLPILFRNRSHDHVFTGTYVGPGVCRGCHEEQAASWMETRMAMTFEVLRPGVKRQEKETAGLDPDYDYTRDEECLPCHTTGYGLMGGFVSFKKTPDMAGVTCEACHGPGGTYADTPTKSVIPKFATSEADDAGLVYPPTAAVCRSCHNEDSPFIDMDYEFEYSERVGQGTHSHYQLKFDHRPDK